MHDAETPGFHGKGCLTPRLVIQLNIKSLSEELTKRRIDVPQSLGREETRGGANHVQETGDADAVL